MKSKWMEIKASHYDENENCYMIDAWKTKNNQSEEGKVIAKVSKFRTEYRDDKAKTDPYAQQVILAASQMFSLHL